MCFILLNIRVLKYTKSHKIKIMKTGRKYPAGNKSAMFFFYDKNIVCKNNNRIWNTPLNFKMT